MIHNFSILDEEIIRLLSLLKGRVIRENVLSLLKDKRTRAAFPGLAGSSYEEIIVGRQIRVRFDPNVLDYDSNEGFIFGPEIDWNNYARQTVLEHPEMAAAVAESVNRLSQPGNDGFLRDIRNFFYAGDVDALNGVLNQMQRNENLHSDIYQAFEFMSGHAEETWVKKLDVKRLELLINDFVPKAMAQLEPVNVITNAVFAKFREYGDDARANLADTLIVQGRLIEADEVTQTLSGAAKMLRQAWLKFFDGNDRATVDAYENLLSIMRKVMRREDAYFQTIAGLYYLFALMRIGEPALLQRAYLYAAYASRTRFYGGTYYYIWRLLHTMVKNPDRDLRLISPTPFMSSSLGDIYITFCNLWKDEVVSKGMDSLRSVLDNGLGTAYPGVAEECQNFLRILDGQRASRKTCIATCLPLRPQWQRVIDKVAALEGEKDAEGSTRLAWMCTKGRSDEAPVIYRPVEQKANRRGGWSKGKAFILQGHPKTLPWPAFFTLQDQLMCNMLLEELGNADGQEKSSRTFSSLRVLEAAIGHPNLFWEETGMAVPFRCLRRKPEIELSQENGYLRLEMYPEYSSKGLVAIHNEHNDLEIFSFSDRNARIAELLGGKVMIPCDVNDKLIPFLRVLAIEFDVYSHVSLDFTGIPIQAGSTVPHIRLEPMDSKMKVEFLVNPFNLQDNFFYPGRGHREILAVDNNEFMRLTRDMAQEVSECESIMLACDMLKDAQALNQYTYQLQDLEQCYHFAMFLQTVMDKVVVHWPENRSIRVSRRITASDLTLTCKKNDGDSLFSVEGSLKLDDGLVLSLRELLDAISKEKGNFIRLKNGQILSLADSFRKRLEDMATITMIQEGQVVFSKFAMPFMAAIIGDGEPMGNAQDWAQKAEELDAAMSLEAPVPDTLCGCTMRPYQEQGYRWLCQLDAWGAGACLADDMGLGKTLQVITFFLHVASEGPMLVVAPTSVCMNWVHELAKFAPSLEVVLFGGNGKRSEMLSSMKAGKVMIASYGLLNSETDAFKSIRWRTVVLDEAQAIKNHNTKRAHAVLGLKARFKIITTGTPIENNLNELWSLFNFVNPGLLGSMERYRDTFVTPIEDYKDEEAAARLSKIVKPFILRRLKTQVLTDLPPKTEICRSVQLSDEERAFYEALRTKLLSEIGNLQCDERQMCYYYIAAITKLRLAACDSRLILPNSNIASAKQDAFCDLIDELLGSGHKILVFSQFVKHLALLKPCLEARKVNYKYLDGDMPGAARDAAVREFQNGDGDVFLISLKAGGQGLNLTEADYVIIMDPWWNPAVEDQAADRAYRFGQKRAVTIYRLIAENTIEDKIVRMHQNKKDLADSILAGTNAVTRISKEELMALLNEESIIDR